MKVFNFASFARQMFAAVFMASLFITEVLADPLAATREVIFAGTDLARTAAELQTPAAMYEYVRNTHEYALYHGSRSNTLNTYGGRRGSDVDIASVLIAMYRSQGIPARYAVGTVSVSAVDAANWLSVRDIDLAAAVMDDQGIQNVNLAIDRQFIEFEHAWVQVQVPYDHYRGAIDNGVNCTTTPSRCHWIDVDPSFKTRRFHNQGIDVYGVVNFDYTRYYNAILNDDAAVRDKGPTEIYEEQILDWLKANHPGKNLEDVADPGTIIPVDNGILPASLPYQVISAVQTYDSIAEHDTVNNPGWAKFLTIRYSLGAFTFTGGLVGPFLLSSSSDPIALADLSTKRITLSYFEGNQIAGDPYEHHQMTVRLDGQIIDTPILIAWQNDQAQFLGRLFDVTFELDGAPSTTNGTDNIISATYNNLMFGGYYVIGTGGDTSNWSQVHRAADQLLAANETFPIISNGSGVPYVDGNGNGVIDAGEGRLLDDPIAQDELTGGLLNVAMNLYYTRFVENTRRLDALNHATSPMEGFVGIVSSTYDVDYLGDTAYSIMPGGLLIDMKGVRFNGSWRNNAPATYASAHFELLGHEGSSLEHEIWQELTGFDAVSTVRGIQMALASGAQLLDLTDGSAATVNGMYSTFGFTSSAPSPFAISVRDVYSTRPTTWSHTTTTGTEGLDLLKKYPATSSELRAARLSYTNDYWHGNVGCFDSQEQAIRDLIAQYGGSATLNAGSICGYSYASGTTLNQLLSGFESYYISFFSIGTGGVFDYLDQLQGFASADFVFRGYLAAADIHSAGLVQTVRNALIFGGTVGSNPGRWEYRIPSRKTNTGFNIFSVYLQKVYDATTNQLASQSYSISNDSFVAGGGWVDGSESLSLSDVTGSVVKPLFDNEVFTDQNLVAVTNNDLIRTPSTADPVSTVTGNMYHDETDVTIKGRGLDYAFTRSYNSGPARADKDGPFGFGWTHSYNMRLRSNDYGKCPNCTTAQAAENGNSTTSSITYLDERGGEHTYILNADGSGTRAVAENPPGEFDTLALNTPASGQFTLTFRNGVKYVFSGNSTLVNTPNLSARLDYIEDPYNNRLTLGYDGSNRLTSVTDNLGITGRTGLTLTYVGATQHIQTVTDWTGRTWTYNYDADGNLDAVLDPLSQTMDYTYHPGTHLLHELIKPQDRSGRKSKTAFTYYRNNKAFNYANALGETETLDYDLYRQRTQVTDPRGFAREHFYDKDNGALIKLKEPDGAILQFDNNSDGLRYLKADGLGYETRYSYQVDRSISEVASSNFGRVSREIDALSQITDTDYGVYDQLMTTVDKRGNPVTRSYYATTNAATFAVAGKVSELRATVGGTPNVPLTAFTYYAGGAAFGQVKQKVEYLDPTNQARQRITDYVYEANGVNLQSLTVRGATGGRSFTTTFTYDDLGRLRTETLNRRTSPTDATLIPLTTTYDYDALDRVTRVTDPSGIIRETVYDANGKVHQEKVHYPTTQARPNCAAPSTGYVVCTYATHTYDAADRRVSTSDMLGYVTRFDYDANGNPVTVTDANGHTVRYEYDAMNRRTAVVDANGHRSEMTYDLGGRLVATRDANGNVTRYEYDPLGRQTKVTTALGFETQTQYDPNGNVTHVIDANAVAGLQPTNAQGVSVYREYDELNRLTLERDALNGETRYTYDLLGNLTSITDAEGQVTRFAYNDLGRRTSVTYPNTVSDQILLYDQAGNVLAERDRSGRPRVHTYDVLNRLRTTRYTYDDPDTEQHYAYDAFGDRVEVRNAEVTYTYSYTSRHELSSKIDSRLVRAMSWTYDPVGNLQTKTDYQGSVTSFQYDSGNRLVAQRNPDYLQVSYHYDGAGRLLDRLLSNGAQTAYRYDAGNRLVGLKNLSANQTVVEDLTYQRDRVGNITQISDAAPGGRSVIYAYDALYRLLGADSSVADEDRSYTYDGVGNRLTETRNGTVYHYCYHPTDCSQGPSANRLYAIRTGSPTGPLHRQFSYDTSGRLLAKQDGAGSPRYTVSYDGKGQARAIATPVFLDTFDYDPSAYRIRKNASDGYRKYLLEGEHLEAVYGAGDELQETYLRGVVVDELVSGYVYPSSTLHERINYTFHHDHLNSVTALTGHAGSVEETTRYDAFGAPLSLAIPGTGNDLLYTGREYDRDSGLYYYRARYYDPEIGRFITEDPIGFAGGINFYAYVNNNPINFNDPSGQILLNAAGAAAGAVYGGVAGSISGAIVGFNTVDPSSGALSQVLGGLGGLAVGGVSGAATGAAAGALLNPALAASAPVQVASGVVGGVFSNIGTTSTQQFINNQPIAPLENLDLSAGGTILTSAVGGAAAVGTLRLGVGMVNSTTSLFGGQQFATTALAESVVSGIGAGVGEVAATPTPISMFNDFGDPQLSFPAFAGVGGAGGGFVLYPSKPNTNMLNSVYQK